MDERAAQLLLNSFPRYADSARLVQLRSGEGGQTFQAAFLGAQPETWSQDIADTFGGCADRACCFATVK
jgi:hypothetical protein